MIDFYRIVRTLKRVTDSLVEFIDSVEAIKSDESKLGEFRLIIE